MSVRFVDTNLLIYATSRNSDEQDKARRANEILDAGKVALSAQVLQEFYCQSTRDTRPNSLTHKEALEFLETLLEFPIVAITTDIVRAAAAARERFRISYWDAAILEAARSLGCEVVLTEDLNDGQDYDGVRVENPFRGL